MDTSKMRIELKQTAGSVAPQYYYEERVTFRGDRVELKRTGGETVNVGKWEIEMDDGMCEKVSTLLNNISSVEDADDVMDIVPVGGGSVHIIIYRNNTEEKYTEGYVIEGDEGGYHKLKPNVKLLVNYINEIIAKIPLIK